VRRRICIANRRADLNDISTGSYNMRTPLLQFLMEEYDRLLQAGYIKEATGQNGRTLCRWINKKEEKELNKARREAEKAEKERKAQERQERYNARCKELEAEALAQMPYKVGDTVKSRYGETGRVIEMHPEITGDIDSPHLIYEYDGKPTVNVVIEVNGKRSCAHWSVYTLEPASEIKEAEGIKVGDKVRHNKHEEVATVTAIREAFVNRCDGYRYLYTLDFGQSVLGPFQVELNGGEFLREAFTLQEAPEIKPKATDSELESLTAKYANQIEESALLGCGCMVGDGDESRKDSKCVKVRTAYKNDSHDAKDWTYCVSWYETAPIKGDADGQSQTLRECENGILLEQAARHMAYFELMARKGWTLDEILYGKAA
jgi:sRNA-binding protein